MPDPTLQERLVQAQRALHELLTGESAVEVRDGNGDSVRYTPANVGRLKSYIAELKAEINSPDQNSLIAKRAPLRPMFG